MSRNHPISYAPVVYSDHGEWRGYTISAGKRGWIVDRWSAVQGELTGRVRLVYYSDDFPRGVRMTAPYSDRATVASALVARAEDLPGKTIRAGHRVE